MKIRSFMVMILAIFLITAIGQTQRRPLKVLVLYDMEGVTGATSAKHVSYFTNRNMRRGGSR